MDLGGKWGPRYLPGISDPMKDKRHQSLTMVGIDLSEFYSNAFAGNPVTNFRLYLQVGKMLGRPKPNRKLGAHGQGLGVRQEEPATAEAQDASRRCFSVHLENGRQVDRNSRVFSQVRPIHRTTPTPDLDVYYGVCG